MVALLYTLVMIPWQTVRVTVEKAFQPSLSKSRWFSQARCSLITDERMGCIVPNCNLYRGRVQKIHEMARERAFCVCCLERKPSPHPQKAQNYGQCLTYVTDVGQHIYYLPSKFKQRTEIALWCSPHTDTNFKNNPKLAQVCRDHRGETSTFLRVVVYSCVRADKTTSWQTCGQQLFSSLKDITCPWRKLRTRQHAVSPAISNKGAPRALVGTDRE